MCLDGSVEADRIVPLFALATRAEGPMGRFLVLNFERSHVASIMSKSVFVLLMGEILCSTQRILGGGAFVGQSIRVQCILFLVYITILFDFGRGYAVCADHSIRWAEQMKWFRDAPCRHGFGDAIRCFAFALALL